MTSHRREYCPPKLVTFGSVRNLTGGSGTVGRDGALTTSKNTPGGG